MSRHPLDLVSLVFGVVFAAIGVVYLIPTIGLRALWSPQLWPVVLVVAGLWLIASTMRRRSRDANEPAPGQDDAAPGQDDAADAHGAAEDPADAYSPSQGPGSHAHRTAGDASAGDEASAADADQESSARSRDS